MTTGKTWPLAAAVLAMALVPGCEGTREPEPQEVAAVSDFEIGHRPALGAADVARAILATSGMAHPDAMPVYSDIEFFPVLHADALEAMSGPRQLRRRDIEPEFSAIDFDRQFAFLVAHPNASGSYRAMSSGQYATYFSSVRVSYPDDRVRVHLSGSRLGGLDPITAMAARWEGKIYPIDRRGRELLEVRLDDNVYTYALAAPEDDAPHADGAASGPAAADPN